MYNSLCSSLPSVTEKNVAYKFILLTLICYFNNSMHTKKWYVNFQKLGLHQIVITLVLITYLLESTSVWIRYLFDKHLFENEQISHCSLWWHLVVWNNDNILQSLAMSLNHHHTWSICHGWNKINNFITVFTIITKWNNLPIFQFKISKTYVNQ